MRRANLIIGRVVITLIASLAMASGGAAQSEKRQKQQEQQAAAWSPNPDEPAVLPVEALKMGSALKESASPELRNWIKKYVNAELRGDTVEPAVTAAYVEKHFAQDSPAMRDALVFLLFYSAYEMEEPLFQGHARTLRDIDKEIKQLRERLRIWEESFTHPPPGSQTDIQRRVDLYTINERLEQLLNRRRVAAHAEETSRAKVDRFLRLLDHGYKMMGDFPPQAIGQMQPIAAISR